MMARRRLAALLFRAAADRDVRFPEAPVLPACPAEEGGRLFSVLPDFAVPEDASRSCALRGLSGPGARFRTASAPVVPAVVFLRPALS